MQQNTAVEALVNKFYNTDDEQYMQQADQLCIDQNLMFDYICNHARYHDKNNLYWLTATNIDDFNNKLENSGFDSIEESITCVLLENNISVQQLNDADIKLLEDTDYDNKYYEA